jgi:hypothetical protein
MGRWDLFGDSNAVVVELGAGPHSLAVSLAPEDRNMNGAVNEALVDGVRFTRLAGGPTGAP